MPATRAEEIIQDVNSKIDPEPLALLLNYHPEKIQVAGHQVKAFCPLHKEQAFRSLLLDAKTHGYRCMMKRCSGFEGGTFVQLWAQWTSQEPLQAALDLAEKLKLAVDVAALRVLGSDLISKARAAFTAGDLASARQMIDQAVAFDPRNLDAGKLSAEIFLRAGEKDRAHEEFLRLIDLALVGREFGPARAMLNPLIASEPKNIEFALRRVAIVKAEGQTGPIAEALVKLAELYSETGSVSSELATLDEILTLGSADARLLERVAEIHERAGRSVKLMETLERLCPAYEAAGDWKKLTAALARRQSHHPEDSALQEQLAVALVKSGDAPSAAPRFMELADYHRAHAGASKAVALLRQFLTAVPDHAAAQEKLALLLAETGQKADAVKVFRDLAAQARAGRRPAEVEKFLSAAKTIDPNDLGLRRDLAETLLTQNRKDQALGELFALADLYLNQTDPQEGFAVLNRIGEIVPNDVGRHLEIGRSLEAAGFDQQAVQHYLAFIQRLQTSNAHTDALAVCNEALRISPRHDQLLEAAVTSNLALGRKTEALQVCRSSAQAFAKAGDFAHAEQLLNRAIKIDRMDPTVKSDLAVVLQAAGRNADALKLHLELALFHRASENTPASLDSARKALDLDGNHPEALALVAEALESRGETEEARAHWQSAARSLLAQDPKSAKALKVLEHALDLAPDDLALLPQVAGLKLKLAGPRAARPLYDQWVAQTAAQGSAPAKLSALESALEAFPDELPWRVELAQLLVQSGQTDAALPHMERLLDAYRAQDQISEPYRQTLALAVQLHPDRLDLRLEYGTVLAQSGDEKQSAQILNDLAQRHLARGDQKAGLDVLQTLLRFQPENRDLLQRIGELLERLGKKQDAVAAYERLVVLSRKLDTWRSNVATLEKLLLLVPDRTDLRLELAQIYESHGDLDHATEHLLAVAQQLVKSDIRGDQTLAVCQKLVSLVNPDFTAPRELLLDCHLARKDIGKAKVELELLGDAALRKGDLARGEQIFKRIQELDPNDIGAGERLGKLYEAKGQLAEAANTYRQVLALYEKRKDTDRIISVLSKLKGLAPKELDLREKLCKTLWAAQGREDQAAQEWYDFIALAVNTDKLKVAQSAMKDATPLFAERWDFRFKFIQLFSRTQEPAKNLKAWKTFAEQALAGSQDGLAREAASEALQLAPGDSELLELRIQANQRLADLDSARTDLLALAEQTRSQKQFGKEEAFLVRALKLQSEDPGLIELLAQSQIAQNHPKDAVATLRRLAEFHESQSDVSTAIRVARRIIELIPADIEAKDDLASLLIKNEQIEPAMDIWRDAAETLAAAGSKDLAIARYESILGHLDRDLNALARRADLTREAHGNEEACPLYHRLLDVVMEDAKPKAIETEFKRVLELAPDQLTLAEKYAAYLQTTGKTKKAAQELLRIAKIYQDERQNFTEALRVIQTLRSFDPANLDVLEEEASILEKLGEKDKAVAALRDLALAYRDGGSLAEAARATAHCAEILSDDVSSQVQAAEAYEGLADSAKATDFYLRAIAIHEGRGELSACIPILKKAIVLNPARLDLGEGLAQLYEQTDQKDSATEQWLEIGADHQHAGDTDRARDIYRHLKDLAPNHLEPRHRLARMAEDSADNEEALKELRELLPLTADLNDEEQSLSLLKRILTLAPEDLPSLLTLADLLRSLRRNDELFETLLKLENLYCARSQFPEALDVLDRMRKLRPEDLDLARSHFDLLVKMGDLKAAAKAGLALVETHLDRGQSEKAGDLIRAVQSLEPANIKRRITLVQKTDAQGYSELALETARDGCQELFEAGNAEGCLELAGAGLSLYPNDVVLRRCKIGALGALEKTDEALEELLNLANLHESENRDDEASKVLQEILSQHPDHVPTHQTLLNMALRQGDNARAGEELIQLAEINYVAGQMGDSIKALQQLLELDPARSELRARLAELHHEAGNAQDAKEVWFQTARELRESGKLGEAIEIYERVWSHYPQDIAALALLTECYGESGSDERYLAHAIQLCDLYNETGDQRHATPILESLADRFPKNADIWERLATNYIQEEVSSKVVHCYKALSEIHQTSRRYDLAKAILEKALALDGSDDGVLQQLGEVCLRLNQRPEGLGHLANAARRLKDQKRYPDARQVIERILKIDPTNLEVLATLGEIFESMDDLTNAIKNYTLAAQGWTERRNHGEAIALYEHALALNPDLIEEREAYAHVLEREGRMDDACEQYLTLVHQSKTDTDPRQVIRYCRQILKEKPDQVEAHTHLYRVYERTRKPRLALEEAQWLADYYISTGDMDHAEEFIRLGLEQAPGEIELRKRFIDILVETNRQAEASENLMELSNSAQAQGDLRTSRWALARACEIQPDNLDHRRQLAELLDSAGELPEARKVRLEILRIHLQHGEMEPARAIGERVVESAPGDEDLRARVAKLFEEAGLPEVAAYHYTHIAKAALANEDYPKVLQVTDAILKIKPRHIPARECLVQALTATGDSAAAASQARELFALYRDGGDLDAAQRALKLVLQHKPSDPEPRKLMVDLLRQMGKTDPMVDQMRKLAEIQSNAGDLVSATQTLKDLMQVRPDDTRARARYIDLYSQLGEESELYEDYLQLARIFRKKGAVVEASQVYDKLLQMHPDRTECREQFVEFLFEQGQINRAIEEARGLITLYLDHDQKVEAGRLLEKTLAKSPGDTQMRHQLAMLQLKTNRRGLALETLRGLLRQYEEAKDAAHQVETLEQILAIDNLNVDLRQRLADLHLNLGQHDKAREQRLNLAQQYLDRQLFDLAEREYQRILDANPADIEVWQRKIQTHLQIGTQAEVLPDMLAMAGILADTGKLKDAVAAYKRILELDADNIEALSRYIETYIQIGMEEDLVDDYLRLATLLSQAGHVDDAVKIYQHLQDLAPDNTRVKARLKEAPVAPAPQPQAVPTAPHATAAKRETKVPAATPAAEAPKPAETPHHEGEDSPLQKAIRNYENILKLNPENPAVRAKLAELIAKTGRMKEADEQWAQAANDFFNRGELNRCIEILDELLGRHPDDARLRERLSRAVLKRESMNAIGSVVDQGKS